MIKLERTLREKRYVQEVRERTRQALEEYNEAQKRMAEAEGAEADGDCDREKDEEDVPALEVMDIDVGFQGEQGMGEISPYVPPAECLVLEYCEDHQEIKFNLRSFEDFLHMEYKPTSLQVIEAIAEIEKLPKIKKLEWTSDLETSLEGLLLACRFDMEKAASLFNEFLDLVDPLCEPVLWQDLAKKWKEMKYSPKKSRPKLDPKWQQLIEVISTRSQASGVPVSKTYSKPSNSDRPATIVKSDIPDDLRSLQSDYEG